MKKILLSVAAVGFAFTLFAANRYNSGETVTVVPTGTREIVLHTPKTNQSKDTIAAGEMNWYGPYKLVSDGSQPIPASLVVVADLITGTTPVASFDYQVINGYTMADTTSTWVAACTLATTAITKPASLSSAAGKAIVFRVNNYDGSADQIPGRLNVIIKSSISHYKVH